jgi:type II secretory pathway pseudopilin PulG
MSRGQGPTVFISIIVLIAAAVGLNYMQHLNSPTEDEVEQQQEQAQAKAVAAQRAAYNKAHPSSAAQSANKSPADPTPPDDSGVLAPVEFISGNPQSAKVITLGYVDDDDTVESPQPLNDVATTLEGWAKQHPAYLVKIICLDLPKDQLSNPADHNVPLGLALNGVAIGGCDTNPGAGIFTSQLVQTVLNGIK